MNSLTLKQDSIGHIYVKGKKVWLKKIPDSYICKKCGVDWPLSAYSKNSRSPIGIVYFCLLCRQKKNKERFESKIPFSPKWKYSILRAGAKRRKIDFDVSLEDYSKLIENPCYYCEGSLPLYGHGIDRKNADDGYVKENMLPCCTSCNIAKQDKTMEEFFLWIETMYSRLQKMKGGV